ncbi:MAG: hypothetical protein ATN31_07300 [Candidatus Epulonipiscioides saccharophilum]|nr:MAG: hypothetical protein ATN31_07300 [Epulopiscium sp. AS2M-Bin001]
MSETKRLILLSLVAALLILAISAGFLAIGYALEPVMGKAWLIYAFMLLNLFLIRRKHLLVEKAQKDQSIQDDK